MKEERKLDMYEDYLIQCWKRAEEIATNKIGITENAVICSIFDKLTEPYGYWKKRFNY